MIAKAMPSLLLCVVKDLHTHNVIAIGCRP